MSDFRAFVAAIEEIDRRDREANEPFGPPEDDGTHVPCWCEEEPDE